MTMSDSDIDDYPESYTGKRALHNAQERERRDHIAKSFDSLRDACPTIRGKKMSRTQVLLKAGEYIETTLEKHARIAQECVLIDQDNKMWEEKIRDRAREKGLDPDAVLADFEREYNSLHTKESSGGSRKKKVKAGSRVTRI